MDFIVKKTTELTSVEKEQILSLFNEVFEKSRTIREFNNQYLNNPLGYSFHSLMLKDGSVAGHNSGIPGYYRVNGERQLFICNVDTMIRKQCRGIDNFYDMMIHATNRYKEEGAKVLYGYPNDNSYPLLKSLGLMEDIGTMVTYCLPYQIGGVRPGLKWLNPLSRMFTRLFVHVSGLLSREKEAEFPISKDLETYNATRYKRGDGKYTVTGDDRNGFAYKVMEYEGIRCAFLIDVWPKSPRSFNKAVSHILKVERKALDLLLYPGHLPFGNTSMIKLPLSMSPKKFHFTGKILDPTLKKEDVYSIEAWDTNLSNYDLL